VGAYRCAQNARPARLVRAIALQPGDDDDLISVAFSLQNNPGAYAVLVGAEISKPAVPTAWEVLTRLAVDVAVLKGDQITADEAEGWWIANIGAEPRYETVLEKVS
jgi:F420-0:gamma-glutamyl ligase-like protein